MNDPFDNVMIDGHLYSARREVVDEIIHLRRGTTHEFIEKIRTMEPSETETVVITTPSGVSTEFMGQVGAMAKQSFPDHGIAVLPENLSIHTQEGFKGLVSTGMELAMSVQEHNLERSLALAKEFIDLIHPDPPPESVA